MSPCPAALCQVLVTAVCLAQMRAKGQGLHASMNQHMHIMSTILFIIETTITITILIINNNNNNDNNNEVIIIVMIRKTIIIIIVLMHASS